MKILNNYSLKDNNTFKISALANRFVEFESDSEFIDFLKTDKNLNIENFLIIGEGSNLLFTGDYNGTVIHPATKNIDIVKEDEENIYVEASAGVVWDYFVEWTILNKAFGLENLSLIPGTVGASAVQNIGAYGVEAGDFIYSVKYVDIESAKVFNLFSKDCKFAYRDSIFKNELKGHFLILSVTYKLSKKPNVKIDYADIVNYFGEKKDINPGEIRNAVINIRNIKLPDPAITGNAGSFFKNPVVDQVKFELLYSKFPDLRYYTLADGNFKLAAGWMIDKCGLKGFAHNGAAVHDKQALVLINKSGEVTGHQILELSEIVKSKVFEIFGVNLEQEVIFI